MRNKLAIAGSARAARRGAMIGGVLALGFAAQGASVPTAQAEIRPAMRGEILDLSAPLALRLPERPSDDDDPMLRGSDLGTPSPSHPGSSHPGSGHPGSDLTETPMLRLAQASEAAAQSEESAETLGGVARRKDARFKEALAAYEAGDLETAFAIWERLAADNDLAALRNVALMLRRGEGVERNPRRARALYRRAADLGYPPAMVNLGVMLLEGDGGKADLDAANRWFYRAARAGDPNGQFHIARQLEHGAGLSRDLTTALAYYHAAARRGHLEARAAVERLSDNGVVRPAYAARVAPQDAAGVEPASNSPRKDLTRLLRGTGIHERDETAPADTPD